MHYGVYNATGNVRAAIAAAEQVLREHMRGSTCWKQLLTGNLRRLKAHPFRRCEWGGECMCTEEVGGAKMLLVLCPGRVGWCVKDGVRGGATVGGVRV